MDDLPAAPADPAVEFQALITRLTPRAWVTPVIVGANVALFVVMLATGVHWFSPSAQTLIDWGANYAPRTTAGQWWRLGSSMFIHIGVLHVAMNMLVFLNVGRFFERLVGNAGFAAIYLVSGLCGSLASIAVHPFVTSAGASGAVFGVYGALVGFLLRQRGAVPRPVLDKLGKGAASFLIYNLVFGLQIEGIDMACHFGGLVGGFVCGLIAGQPLVGEAVIAKRRVRTLAVLAFGAVAVSAGAFAVPKSPDVQAELQKFDDVEKEAIKIYNDTVAKGQAGTISDKDYAVVLRTKVLPPWSAMHARIKAMAAKKLPKKMASLVDTIERYSNERQLAWEQYADALEAGDQEKAVASQKHHAAAQRILDELQKPDKK